MSRPTGIATNDRGQYRDPGVLQVLDDAAGRQSGGPGPVGGGEDEVQCLLHSAIVYWSIPVLSMGIRETRRVEETMFSRSMTT